MQIIYKPWGKEEWLEKNDFYCYKRIYINSEYRTSYQYHEQKIETNYIISGEAEVWLENDKHEIQITNMKSGDFFTVQKMKKHRIYAKTDLILQEVSTPQIDDVIRISDDNNRINGKIESEQLKPAFCIVSSGKGTRMHHLTENINKALLPINGKAVISHIIEKVPYDCDIIITTGYKSETLIEYCEAAHKDRNISHRGNLNGKNIERENSPEYIREALDNGYEIEIDIWFENNKWLLGHDIPKYEIDLDIINKFLFDKLWFHCKNLQSLEKLSKYDNIHYFWHQNDSYTLTSKNYIWTFPGEKLSERSICVLPENSNYSNEELKKCYGICSDYIMRKLFLLLK